jgi:hypothetical protein
MHNPFQFGAVVSGEQFVGRHRETRQLFSTFKRGTNTLLVAPRQYGKTSLLRKVATMAEKKRIKTIIIDALSCRTPEAFYTLLATEAIKRSSSHSRDWEELARRWLGGLHPEIALGEHPEKDLSLKLDFSGGEAAVEAVLRLPQQISYMRDARLVVCIDEFQQTAEFADAPAFYKKLHSAWHTHRKIAYCFCGCKPSLLSALFLTPQQPLYRFGEVLTLPEISRFEWEPFLCDGFSATLKKIRPELATQLCDTVENQPGYVQQLAWILWNKTNRNVIPATLKASVRELLHQNSVLYRGYLESLSASQLEVLRALVEGAPSPPAPNGQQEGDATKTPDAIEDGVQAAVFHDPMFRLWFKNRAGSSC